MVSNVIKATSDAGELVEHLLVVRGSTKVGAMRALHVPNPSLAVASFRAVRCTWKRSVGIANGCQSTIPCWKPYWWSLELLPVSSGPLTSLLNPVHADRTARMVSRASRTSVFACALLLLSCSDYQTHIPTESPACPLHAQPTDPRPPPWTSSSTFFIIK